MSDVLRAKGVTRDAEGGGITVYFNRNPTNDELRALHEHLRKPPAVCPFCSLPTYDLPCWSCGEPDVPDGEFLMAKGNPVPVMGVWLKRLGEHAIVSVEFEDGRCVDIIKEHLEGNFSHNVTEHGLQSAFDGTRPSP